jgi:alpha-D-xyloside xylohydrolase
MVLAGRLRTLPDGVEWRGGHEVLVVRGWGNDSVRVQVALSEITQGLPGALLEPGPPPQVRVAVDEKGAVVANGALSASVSAAGEVAFTDTRTGALLLREEAAHFWWPGARLFAATGNGYHRIEQRFEARRGERLCGLGQHTHGLLDQKGCVIDLLQRNGEVTVPFVLSNLGYGFLWNSPAIGRVELGGTGTRWVADSARQLDYWVTAGRCSSNTPRSRARRPCSRAGRRVFGNPSYGTRPRKSS